MPIHTTFIQYIRQQRKKHDCGKSIQTWLIHLPLFSLTIQLEIMQWPSLDWNREFKKLRRQLQRKHDIKIELYVKLSLLWLFHVDHVVQNRRTALPLLGTNGFHVKAKSERFTAVSSRCRQNLKYENFTSSFGRPKSVPHVQHDYFSSFKSFNQIIDLWRCRWRCRRQILNSLILISPTQRLIEILLSDRCLLYVPREKHADFMRYATCQLVLRTLVYEPIWK